MQYSDACAQASLVPLVVLKDLEASLTNSQIQQYSNNETPREKLTISKTLLDFYTCFVHAFLIFFHNVLVVVRSLAYRRAQTNFVSEARLPG